ncbi:MAG: zinc-ribbon domain containing protein [Deltaproteobacteria bacterium]|nr:zinc-ribbon domain containing protein [Deltaproteobacteria bacterium]
MEDKIIQCVQCNGSFVFSVEEQVRFASKGFNDPRRCHECRKKKFKLGDSNERDRNGLKRSRQNV